MDLIEWCLPLRIIGDFHIHSRFSRATSPALNLHSLAENARIKGLDLLGTGDITHRKWLAEVSEQLEDNDGIFHLKGNKEKTPKFVITSEVATVFPHDSKSRKIHHCLLLPDLESAKQLSGKLQQKGNLEEDGRPILNMTAAELVEILKGIASEAEIYPAHAWTPWWSLFGANFGFDSLKECYQEYHSEIHALETGLSSDPPMNWRVSELDKLTLLSNSDCHSAYPFRLGREANIFELENLTYSSLIDAIRRKGRGRVVSTIETKPEYGKYHWTGHRNCGVSFSSDESKKIGAKCPKCGKNMVIKLGRGGKFYSCSTYPECDGALTMEGLEIKGDVPIGLHPESQLPIFVKTGKYGPYVQHGLMEKTSRQARGKAKPAKPKMASIPKEKNPTEVTVADALVYLSLPKVLGAHPETGKNITASIGRFGPYVVHDTDFRSVRKDDIYKISLDRALEIINEPKKPRGFQKKKVEEKK